MGRGRPRKPNALKILEGNPGKRQLNEDAPSPVGGAEMPVYVKGYAVEIWNQVIGSMPPNLYSAVDSVGLASFCVAVSQYRRATEQLEIEGLTIEDAEGNMKAHPALTAQTKALNVIAQIGSRLGLDPTSRSAMRMPRDPKAPSKFDGLMSGANSPETRALA